jgi:hypothetical protein
MNFQFTEDQFAHELEQAIRESKIDFEEKKDFYRNVELSKQHALAAAAAKKPIKISLNEFNAMDAQQVMVLEKSSVPVLAYFGSNLGVDIFTVGNLEVDIFTGSNLEVNIFTSGNWEVDIFTGGNWEVDIFTVGNWEVDIGT